MRKICFILLFLAVIASVATLAPAQDAGFKVIVNPKITVNSLSRSQISSIFLKKLNRWPDSDQSAKPVDLDSSSPVREAFSQDIHKRSVSNIKNFWQRQIFSGKDLPPVEARDEAEMLRLVRDNPGGIGYVSASASTTGVKVLTVVD
ncbi:MAG: hypothetical protein HC897_03250 [Thermoanaerobaculia bacterium]|nr:hypothetical protein [Thermoanaerobaculia bacterium]